MGLVQHVSLFHFILLGGDFRVFFITSIFYLALEMFSWTQNDDTLDEDLPTRLDQYDRAMSIAMSTNFRAGK